MPVNITVQNLVAACRLLCLQLCGSGGKAVDTTNPLSDLPDWALLSARTENLIMGA